VDFATISSFLSQVESTSGVLSDTIANYKESITNINYTEVISKLYFTTTSFLRPQFDLSTRLLWDSVTKYKEIITNGLDLISFILVTPQLVKFGGLRVRIAEQTKSLLDLGFVLLVIIVVIAKPYIFIPGVFIIILAFVGLFSFALSVMFRKYVDMIDRTTLKIGRFVGREESLFYVGVVLFFLSRVIAFLTALYPEPRIE
jgi:hypothetical protein